MLEIRGLRKAYREREVLRGVDLDVARGEVLGLVGPNGAGKTTLVSIVAGLREADAGSVRVDGIDALAHPDRVHPLLGIAPQDLGIYPILTVAQNLEFFGRLSDLRGAELRRTVAATAEALGLTGVLGQRAATLSGGQTRRLHTAMALVGRPALLFLDEPTVGADVQTRAAILEIVRDLAHDGRAVVYTSHYLSEIETLGASVAVLEAGRIVAGGSVAELVSRYGEPALRLRFDGPAPAVALPGFEIDGAEATLRTADPTAVAAAVLAGLNGEGSRVRSIDVVRPSLEAAYLALTGHRLATVDARAEDAESLTETPEEGRDALVA